MPVDIVLELKNDGRPMTAIVDNALFDLVHQLQTGRINNFIRSFLFLRSNNGTELISCQYKLDATSVEYLQYNGYNLTTCIKYALTATLKTQ